MAVFTLEHIPGFADLPDAAIAADQIAFGLHIGSISENATNAMVRREVFTAIYKNGETVELPISKRDQYRYQRDELQYFWFVRNSANPSSNWISGPDCLWFFNHFVNQTTGEVFSEEWYRRSGEHDQNQNSQDGSLFVVTLATRQWTSLILAEEPDYPAIDEADIVTDNPLIEELIQAISHRAKLAQVSTEIINCGEFVDGDTVPPPTSIVDGHTYSYAECKFHPCWRWSTLGTKYTQPDKNLGQLGPFKGSVDSSGNVSLEVNFVGDSGAVAPVANFGRVTVFAFCTRDTVPVTAPLADDFTEQEFEKFFPGQPLLASTLLAVKKNADEAILAQEFFGPDDYSNGDTVPLPTSAVDGYVYTREEIKYVPFWADTTNQTGSHLRLPLYAGEVNESTGLVTLQVYRLPPGGPIVDDNNTLCSITVLRIATRQLSHDATDNPPSDPNPPGDPGTLPPGGRSGSYVNGLGG